MSSANWTAELLATYLSKHTGIAVSLETVRVYLHAHGYGGLAPELDAATQGRRAGGLCEKRLRVEVVLAGATAPEPLPVQDLVEAPGDNRKVYGFGLVDWRDGWFDGRIANARTADIFCDQVGAAVARSKLRGRVAILITDNLKTHTSQGSLLVRSMLTELSDQLFLVYTPAYDPDANRIEWLWRISRRTITHNHQGRTSTPCARPLTICFVILAVLLHLTSVPLSHKPMLHNQPGSI